MRGIIDFFTRKDASREDKRNRFGAIFFFLLCLTAFLLLISQTTAGTITLLISSIFLGIFLHDALTDPNWHENPHH